MKPKLIINQFGTKYWFINGKCHREDGPAIIYSDGAMAWWIDDKPISQKGWLNTILSRYLNET